ncbi:MAG: hypothetical protein Q4G30_07250 [Actinomycetaceae bacterium]|nr:hypothetical protein [Actinomycetaceae bacterium]
MAFDVFSLTHSGNSLRVVEVAAAFADAISASLSQKTEVRGFVKVSTCNRVEFYLHTDTGGTDFGPPTTPCIAEGDTSSVAAVIFAQVLQGLEPFITEDRSQDPSHIQEIGNWRHRQACDALNHLFRVASGLDSMVVGEREISGQVRRALVQARREGTCSGLLDSCFSAALRTSRKVAQLTGLTSAGRSTVGVAFDLAADLTGGNVPSKALIIGTGSYAGAVVAQLRARGVQELLSFRSSERAVTFAAGHELGLIDATELVKVLAEVDMVITCSGTGRVVVTPSIVAEALGERAKRLADQLEYQPENQGNPGNKPLVFIDMALNRDIPVEVADMDNVVLLTLQDVQKHVPELSTQAISRAEELVAQGLDAMRAQASSASVAPAITLMRDTITALAEEEVQRLPQVQHLTPEQAAQAIRRLAARIAHTPTLAAHQAVAQGDGQHWVDAFTTVFGIDVLAEFRSEVAS